jgi:hypothetical protein
LQSPSAFFSRLVGVTNDRIRAVLPGRRHLG